MLTMAGHEASVFPWYREFPQVTPHRQEDQADTHCHLRHVTMSHHRIAPNLVHTHHCARCFHRL